VTVDVVEELEEVVELVVVDVLVVEVDVLVDVEVVVVAAASNTSTIWLRTCAAGPADVQVIV